MIIISKDEAMYLREVIPWVYIVKTQKKHGSKCGKYYVEETKEVMRALQDGREKE